MKIIGITGGVGAGKSTVLAMLLKLCKCEIVMADDTAKDLMIKGGPLTDKAIELFGDKVYFEDGKINTAYTAKIMYSDKQLRSKWESFVHPAVNKEIYSRIDTAKSSGNYDFIFIEAALLIENGYEKICDELWYVYADTAVRIERLSADRGYSLQKSQNIIKSQMSDDEYRKHCTFVIDTSKTLEETRLQLQNKLEEYA